MKNPIPFKITFDDFLGLFRRLSQHNAIKAIFIFIANIIVAVNICICN